MEKRRTYDTQFKIETVRLITEQGMSSIQVAKDIGVHANTIYKWVQQYKANPDDAFPGKGHLKPEDEELRKLRRRNADLEEENAILKKAMAIFTKHPR